MAIKKPMVINVSIPAYTLLIYARMNAAKLFSKVKPALPARREKSKGKEVPRREGARREGREGRSRKSRSRERPRQGQAEVGSSTGL